MTATLIRQVLEAIAASRTQLDELQQQLEELIEADPVAHTAVLLVGDACAELLTLEEALATVLDEDPPGGPGGDLDIH